MNLAVSQHHEMAYCPVCGAENSGLACEKNGYDIRVCSACDFVFAWPRPSVEQLHDFYQNYKNNASYLKKVKKKTLSSKRKVARLKPLAPGRKLIDIGCSIGCVVEAAHQLGFEASGVDLSADAIEAAKQLFPHCQFGTEDTKALIQQGNLYDVIYCSEVVEHLIDPVDFFNDIYQLLNSGGIIYLTTPDIGHFSVPKDLKKWRHLSPPEHISLFTKKSMRHAIELANLEVVKFRWSHKSTLKVIARKT